MTLSPILNAPPAIDIHMVAIVAAIILTLAQIIDTKEVTAHRVLENSSF